MKSRSPLHRVSSFRRGSPVRRRAGRLISPIRKNWGRFRNRLTSRLDVKKYRGNPVSSRGRLNMSKSLRSRFMRRGFSRMRKAYNLSDAADYWLEILYHSVSYFDFDGFGNKSPDKWENIEILAAGDLGVGMGNAANRSNSHASTPIEEAFDDLETDEEREAFEEAGDELYELAEKLMRDRGFNSPDDLLRAVRQDYKDNYPGEFEGDDDVDVDDDDYWEMIRGRKSSRIRRRFMRRGSSRMRKAGGLSAAAESWLEELYHFVTDWDGFGNKSSDKWDDEEVFAAWLVGDSMQEAADVVRSAAFTPFDEAYDNLETEEERREFSAAGEELWDFASSMIYDRGYSSPADLEQAIEEGRDEDIDLRARGRSRFRRRGGRSRGRSRVMRRRSTGRTRNRFLRRAGNRIKALKRRSLRKMRLSRGSADNIGKSRTLNGGNNMRNPLLRSRRGRVRGRNRVMRAGRRSRVLNRFSPLRKMISFDDEEEEVRFRELLDEIQENPDPDNEDFQSALAELSAMLPSDDDEEGAMDEGEEEDVQERMRRRGRGRILRRSPIRRRSPVRRSVGRVRRASYRKTMKPRGSTIHDKPAQAVNPPAKMDRPPGEQKRKRRSMRKSGGEFNWDDSRPRVSPRQSRFSKNANRRGSKEDATLNSVLEKLSEQQNDLTKKFMELQSAQSQNQGVISEIVTALDDVKGTTAVSKAVRGQSYPENNNFNNESDMMDDMFFKAVSNQKYVAGP